MSRYAAALILVGGALLARVALHRVLGEGVPYLQFFPAIMVASWYGGFGPGAVATLLSAMAAAYWFLAPYKSFLIGDVSDVVSCALFIGTGLIIARLNESLRRAEAKQWQIAERLRAQYSALMQLTQGQLAAIVESSNDAIVGKDLNRTIIAWNRGAERLFGYTAEEAIGQPITMIIPEDRLGELEHVMGRVLAGERVEPFETVRRRKDGTAIEVSVTVSPIRDASGAIVGVSKIGRDITEQRRNARMRDELLARERAAREEAIAARDRLQFLAEVSATLSSSLDYEKTLDRAVHIALPRLGDYCTVLLQDEHGRLRHAAWGHVVPEKEPIVQKLVDLVFSPAGANVPTFASEILRTGQRLVVTHDALAAAVASRLGSIDREIAEIGAELRPFSYIGAPLVVRGRPIGVIAFGRTEQESARDYTDADVEVFDEFARRVSIAIENARLFRQADQLNRLKDEFLATVSHELRTPLSAILGWSRLLASGHLQGAKAARAVDVIERNAQLQAKLVDDILDVARGIAGNVRLDLRPVDLSGVAARGVEAIVPAAAAKKIAVNVDAPASVVVNGDSARLQQVVWNLLSNAVKFTPVGGRVTVNVGTLDGSAELEVTDTGAGIPRDFLPYVFDKFRQADASFTRQYGGLGLGLAIARHLVELHGGVVEARSEGEGHGATFIVRLPLAQTGG